MPRKKRTKKTLPPDGIVRFDQYAGARAWDETRVLTVLNPGSGLPPNEYAFIEHYCANPSCDCRRVVLQVWSKTTPGQVLATIGYGWEDEAFYTAWNWGDDKMGKEMKGPTLETFQPQSNLAEKLLHQFIKVGLPVTGQPPRRSLRAVFPHKAPLSGRAVTFRQGA